MPEYLRQTEVLSTFVGQKYLRHAGIRKKSKGFCECMFSSKGVNGKRNAAVNCDVPGGKVCCVWRSEHASGKKSVGQREYYCILRKPLTACRLATYTPLFYDSNNFALARLLCISLLFTVLTKNTLNVDLICFTSTNAS